MRYAENQASFTLKDEKGSSILIVTKLIEGNYPNYRQVIPAETKERISLVREEFLHALRRAEIMTSEKSNSVKLSFGKNKLEITANSPEVGEAKESLAVNYKGKEMAIAFNPKYMIDPLNALPERRGFHRADRRTEPRRAEDQWPVPLRGDANAAELKRARKKLL